MLLSSQSFAITIYICYMFDRISCDVRIAKLQQATNYTSMKITNVPWHSENTTKSRADVRSSGRRPR